MVSATPRCRGTGFTILELLVVLAILAILVGFLIPSIGNVQQAVRGTGCLSNQRQIATVMLVYAGTYRDIVPRESGASEGLHGPSVPAYEGAPVNISWAFNFRPLLAPHADTTTGDGFAGCAVLRDPARPRDDLDVHYVVNGLRFFSPDVVSSTGKGPTPLHRIGRPEQTPYLACLGDNSPGAQFDSAFVGLPDDLLVSMRLDVWSPVIIRSYSVRSPSLRELVSATRHGRGGNAAYMDGHARMVEAERLHDPFAWDDGDYR